MSKLRIRPGTMWGPRKPGGPVIILLKPQGKHRFRIANITVDPKMELMTHGEVARYLTACNFEYIGCMPQKDNGRPYNIWVLEHQSHKRWIPVGGENTSSIYDRDDLVYARRAMKKLNPDTRFRIAQYEVSSVNTV